MRAGSLLVVCLLLSAASRGATETTITIELVDLPLVEAVQRIAAAGELKVVVGPLDPEPGRITASVADIPARAALDRLIRVQPSLELVTFDDVLILRAKPATAAPPANPAVRRPAPLPAAPSRLPVEATQAPVATGAPVVASTRYVRIPLRYAYAPGLAERSGVVACGWRYVPGRVTGAGVRSRAGRDSARWWVSQSWLAGGLGVAVGGGGFGAVAGGPAAGSGDSSYRWHRGVGGGRLAERDDRQVAAPSAPKKDPRRPGGRRGVLAD